MMSDTRRYVVRPDQRSRSCMSESCENDQFQSLSRLMKLMHIIKRLTVNCDTPRQYLNFNRTDLWYFSSFSVTRPSNLGCYEESFSSPTIWGLFLFYLLKQHLWQHFYCVTYIHGTECAIAWCLYFCLLCNSIASQQLNAGTIWYHDHSCPQCVHTNLQHRLFVWTLHDMA